MQKQLETSQARADGLQAQIAELTLALSKAKTESKALGLRLAAARTAAESAKVSALPGSSMKGAGNGARGAGANGGPMAMMGGRSQADSAAQLKLDLYDDLTGLIITGVKREGGEDVFDCLQTGRNGSMTGVSWLACVVIRVSGPRPESETRPSFSSKPCDWSDADAHASFPSQRFTSSSWSPARRPTTTHDLHTCRSWSSCVTASSSQYCPTSWWRRSPSRGRRCPSSTRVS